MAFIHRHSSILSRGLEFRGPRFESWLDLNVFFHQTHLLFAFSTAHNLFEAENSSGVGKTIIIGCGTYG